MIDDPHDDTTTACLFQCGESDLFAVSCDQTGANIPKSECASGWLLRNSFRLGVREPVPGGARSGEAICTTARCVRAQYSCHQGDRPRYWRLVPQ
jgi:hypothetical protein